MAAAADAPQFTVKEYLALEAVAEAKHEYSGGRIVAMAGAELAHNQIAHNVHFELELAFRDRGCRVLGADQRVHVAATGEYYYPDVVVTCREPELVDPKPRSLVNPEIIVEVQSEATAAYDHGAKWLAYRTIPTLTDYVMIASTRREVEHYRRRDDGTWTSVTIRDGACELVGGAVLSLDKLYRLA